MYTPVNLTLGLRQLRSLVTGKSVRLSPENMQEGPIMIFLNEQQVKKMKKALEKGVGMTLAFSPEDLNYNLEHGGSFWRKIVSGLRSAGRTIFENLLRPIWQNVQPSLEEGRQRLVTRGSDVIRGGIESGLRRVGAGFKAKKGVYPPQLKRYHEMKRAAKPKKEKTKKQKVIEGEGFFGDLARGAAAYGVRQGGPALSNLLADKIEGKGLMGNFGLFGKGIGEIQQVPALSLQSNPVRGRVPQVPKKMRGGSFRMP